MPLAGNSLGVIVGSAFHPEMIAESPLIRREIETRFGPWELYELPDRHRPVYLSFRHGYPHRLLPNQIPYRVQAEAFRLVNCGALLVTSSVGVLTQDLPLYQPLLLTDIITLDNRLPDGDACTMFPEAHPDQGHLVLSEGLFSMALSAQLKELAAQGGLIERDRIVFGYVGGPRTKSAAENRMWRTLGAHVNSMTLAPEVILANELGIPCAGVVVGHKYSIPDIVALPDELAVTETLESSRDALQLIVRVFAGKGEPVPFANHLYRYDQEASRR